MFEKLKKKYMIMLQIDSTKEAAIIGSMEGYGSIRDDRFTEELYMNRKVQITIPTLRTYWGAAKRLRKYSEKGILGCIIER